MLAAAEAETRRLLARYGEPSVVEPPADLAHRVIGALPSTSSPPTMSRLPRIYGWLILIGCAALVALGTWGVLLDSSGPAHIVSTLSASLGQLLLLLTLTAKPLINLLLSTGIATLVVVVAILAGSWLWWQLLRRELATSLEARA